MEAKGGSSKVNAKLVAFVEGLAVLKKSDGALARVPVDKLSEADVEYLKDVVKVHPKAYVVFGIVSAVASGSEVTITVADKHQEIVLFGIAPPKLGQFYHDDAKEALSRKITGKHVWFEWSERNDKKKPVGILYHNGRNVNLDMLAEGMAWCDQKQTADPKLLNAESVAKARRIGLWQNPDAEAPWE